MSHPGKVTAGFARTRPVKKSGAIPESTVDDKYFKYLSDYIVQLAFKRILDRKKISYLTPSAPDIFIAIIYWYQ